jgi:hypothetical protein
MIHDGLPDIGFDRPIQYWDIPEDERNTRIFLTDDYCIIDDEHFFIRGVIEIPVAGYPQTFGIGVWVSQKKENFQTYINDLDANNIGPFFGWLSTKITFYREDTLYLKTRAHFRSGGLRPFIEVEATDHPLSVDQRNGISIDRAFMIIHYYQDLLN